MTTVSPSPSLIDLYHSHKGKTSDKWASYLPIYERELMPLQGKPISFMEIGIQNGGSLEIWSRYLPQAQHIVGCDIDPKCGNLKYDDPRIKVIVGDATRPSTLAATQAISPAYDFIIEDGSHIPREVILTFLQFWPLITPGGCFIAEDLHCDYYPSHEGGLDVPVQANRFFAQLVHLMNKEHWDRSASPATLLAGFPLPVDFSPAPLVDSIASISFYNSVVVIRKATHVTDTKLGPRVIVGDVAAVDAAGIALREKMLADKAAAEQKKSTSFANLFKR